MMELLKQLQKKRKIIKVIFLITFIFFNYTSFLYAKVFSKILTIEGTFIQGGLLFGKTKPNSKIFFNDKKIFVNNEGDFLLGISRDEKKENLLIVNNENKVEKYNINILSRKYKIQKIDGLPKNKVTPNQEELKRIKKESKLISKYKNLFLDKTFYKSGFVWPVEGKVTGKYGDQRILNGKPRRPHFGIDIVASLGSKIISPSDAIVAFTFENTFFNGKMIILNHGLGLNSIYSHLNKIYVKKGDKLKRGDLLAEVGSTGRATGPHLHWGMNVFNTAVDPEKLIQNQPKF